MTKYIRYCLYLVVLYQYSFANATEDDFFFNAIRLDNAPVVTQLLADGFDPNTRGPEGQPALLMALREPSPKALGALLGASNLQVDIHNAQGESPLMLAAIKGLTDACERLIALGADVNKTGWTPLHYAASGGHAAVVQLLLDHHAYIDAESPNGSTPLMMAAMYGSPLVVDLLLQSGADPELKNSLELTALDFAVRAQRLDAAERIRAAIRSKQPAHRW